MTFTRLRKSNGPIHFNLSVRLYSHCYSNVVYLPLNVPTLKIDCLLSHVNRIIEQLIPAA